MIAAVSHRGEQRVDGEEGCSVQLVKGVLKQFPEGDVVELRVAGRGEKRKGSGFRNPGSQELPVFGEGGRPGSRSLTDSV